MYAVLWTAVFSNVFVIVVVVVVIIINTPLIFSVVSRSTSYFCSGEIWDSFLKYNLIKVESSYWTIPEAARSKARVYGRSPAEIVGSNPAGGMDVCLLWVLCVVR